MRGRTFLLAAVLGWHAVAGAEDAPAPAATGSPIPVPEIAVRAEADSAELESIERSLDGARHTVQAVERDLASLLSRLELLERRTDAILRGRPGPGALAQLATDWAELKETLEARQNALTGVATRLQGELDRLEAHHAAWTLSRQHAEDEEAPPFVLQRAQAMLDDLRGTKGKIEQYRAEALARQDQVARQVIRSNRALERVAEIQNVPRPSLLSADLPPAWSSENPNRAWRTTLLQVGPSLVDQFRSLRLFLETRRHALSFHLAIFVLLLLALRRAQRRLPRWQEEEPALARLTAVLRLPASAAAVLATALLGISLSDPPAAFRFLLAFAVVVPVLRAVRELIDPAFVPALYALAAFTLVDRTVDLLAVDAALVQAIGLVELPVEAAVVALLLRGPIARAAQDHHAARRIQIFGRLLLTVIALAFASTALGYVRLGRLQADAIIPSANAAVILWAASHVVEGVVALLLRARPLALLGSVRRHRSMIQERCNRLIGWAFLLGWAHLTLVVLEADAAAAAALGALLGASFTYGSVRLSLGNAVAFAVAIAGSILVSRLVRFAIADDLSSRLGKYPGADYTFLTFLHYCLVAGGFLLGLALLGVNLSHFVILGSAFGVGIGFGLQNIVNNFVSGLILLFERPVRVGDRVQTGDLAGQITRIGFRSSAVQTPDGAEVIVPNSTLITDSVTNWTLSNRLRRMHLPVGLAYGTDKRQALDILIAVAAKHPLVVSQPPPAALFTGFGDSALNFELQAWTDRPEVAQQTLSDLGLALDDAFRAAGVEVPFPQRTVHLAPAEPGRAP